MNDARNHSHRTPPVGGRGERIRKLKAAVARYRRMSAASAVVAVLLALGLVGFIATDEPEVVPLGTGVATVHDTVASDTTREPSGEGDVPNGSEEAVDLPGGEASEELPEGDASYYGDEFAGRPTASGETFDPKELTAAHRTLPFGTRLRVTNVSNGRSVVVRVNDRGPFAKGRVLDLSHAAARQLGMVSRGHGRVQMAVLP